MFVKFHMSEWRKEEEVGININHFVGQKPHTKKSGGNLKKQPANQPTPGVLYLPLNFGVSRKQHSREF